MRKLLLPLIVLVLVLAACETTQETVRRTQIKRQKLSHIKQMMVKQLKYLKIQNVLQLLHLHTSGIKKLGGNIVAVSNQVDQSHILKDKFKGVTKVGDDDVEKVAKQNQI